MPTFEEGDEELLKYTVDYIAFSYYRSNTVKTGEFNYERPAHECVNEKQIKNPHCEANEWDWEIDPVGFRWTLNDLHHRTGLPVFVLENGIGWREDMSQEEVDQMLAEVVQLKMIIVLIIIEIISKKWKMQSLKMV